MQKKFPILNFFLVFLPKGNSGGNYSKPASERTAKPSLIQISIFSTNSGLVFFDLHINIINYSRCVRNLVWPEVSSSYLIFTTET